jgi:hypothetical protein
MDKGVIHPESNMGLPEDTTLAFNRTDKSVLLADLRKRGDFVVQVTGHYQYPPSIGKHWVSENANAEPEKRNTRAYFAGKDMADIIARIQVHKVMEA